MAVYPLERLRGFDVPWLFDKVSPDQEDDKTQGIINDRTSPSIYLLMRLVPT